MSNTIKITQAVSQCNVNTGKPIKEIELELGSKLRPNSSTYAGKQVVYQFKNGIKKTITFDEVQAICEVTGVDANFLFEIG